MRTIVYQSYRTTHVPAWIELCMQTVRSWATSNEFEYQFIDDRLFNYVPPWFFQKTGKEICPATDFARLAVAKELLAHGFDRTIWVDADIVVFAPDLMAMDITNDFAFCHEVWAVPDENDQAVCEHRVNNSITVFTKSNIHLDFFIDACLRIAHNKPQLGKCDVGTVFLSQLRAILPFRLLSNVGMFNPYVMSDISNGTEQFLRSYAQHMPAPLACANLCSSLLGIQLPGITADNRFYEGVLEKCLKTKGDIINQFFK